jgi:hypothetical protein
MNKATEADKLLARFFDKNASARKRLRTCVDFLRNCNPKQKTDFLLNQSTAVNKVL